MTHHLRRLLVLTAFSLLTVANLATCRADGPYHFLKEIAVGGEGGWDYLSIDEAQRRLYVTHADRVVVIDLDKEQVVGAITNTPGVHGFALAPGLQRGFASNGKDATVSVVDLRTLQTLARVSTGENPDAILYETGQHEVYAFNGRGQSATVFAAATGKVVATIPLPGKPEFVAADPAQWRVYCNIEDKDAVVAIDTEPHLIVSTWPVAPGQEPAGLALDSDRHRLFVGCHNQKLVMLDSTTGNVLDTLPIGAGVDANVFDPGTQLIFSSCGDGTVTIGRADAAGKLTLVQTLTTERGARTMALDPATHKIYLATANFEPVPESAAGAARQRPKIIAGTFKILVYGTEPVPAKP